MSQDLTIIIILILLVVFIYLTYLAMALLTSSEIAAPIAALLTVLAGVVLARCIDAMNASPAEESDVFKTVAHLDLSYRDDLELISKDLANDVAYYRYVQPEYSVEVGDTVYLFDGVEASLTSVDAVGFTFTCDCILSEGMSGTAVLNVEGTQIGCISRRLDTGAYYAIWN